MKKIISILFFIFLCSCVSQQKYNDDMSNLATELGLTKNKLDKVKNQLDNIEIEAILLRKECERQANAFKRRLENEIRSGQINVTQYKNKIIVTIDNQILFDTGKIKLKNNALSSLNKIRMILEEYDCSKIYIEGNTDDVPIHNRRFRNNWDLSAERSLTVLYYLLNNKGIDPRRFVSIAHGEYNPIDTNETDIGKQNNRRVDIIIVPEVCKIKK